MNFVDSLKKWFFNNSSSAATTTSKVPLVDNTGNPIGCDTLAHLAQVQDLASVLGGLPYRSTISESELSSLFVNGTYYLASTPNLNIGAASLISFKWANAMSNYCQILISISGDTILVRFYSNNNWMSWYKVTKLYSIINTGHL